MSENDKSKDKQSYGLRVFNATHFYNNKPSNQIQVHSTKPFLKDGKWITSGSVRVTMTKFNGQEKQYNSINYYLGKVKHLFSFCINNKSGNRNL